MSERTSRCPRKHWPDTFIKRRAAVRACADAMKTALPLSTICNYPRTARGVKVAIVGALDGTHIGGSLARAAAQLKLEAIVFDVADASSANRYRRALYWRFAGRRPIHLGRFSAQVIATCATARPEILIATGAAPLTEHALRALQALGIVCINYSTDDPWNSTHLAHWYLRALPAYNAVFTTRRANLDDIRRLGCVNVHYLPFAYDDVLFAPPDGAMDAPAHDVLFVGGADRDRVAFIWRL